MISTPGVRSDLFRRDPAKVLVTDFFGSVHSIEMSNSSATDLLEDTSCRYNIMHPLYIDNDWSKHKCWITLTSATSSSQLWSNYNYFKQLPGVWLTWTTVSIGVSTDRQLFFLLGFSIHFTVLTVIVLHLNLVDQTPISSQNQTLSHSPSHTHKHYIKLNYHWH